VADEEVKAMEIASRLRGTHVAPTMPAPKPVKTFADLTERDIVATFGFLP